MVDKVLIDSAQRLKALYQEASKDPFPVRTDAYPSLDSDAMPAGQEDYNPYCNNAGAFSDDFKGVRRLHEAWKSALKRHLGPEKDVDLARILILYTEHDHECVYPPQKLPSKGAQTLLAKQYLLD